MIFVLYNDDLLVHVHCRDLKPENILLDCQASQKALHLYLSLL